MADPNDPYNYGQRSGAMSAMDWFLGRALPETWPANRVSPGYPVDYTPGQALPVQTATPPAGPSAYPQGVYGSGYQNPGSTAPALPPVVSSAAAATPPAPATPPQIPVGYGQPGAAPPLSGSTVPEDPRITALRLNPAAMSSPTYEPNAPSIYRPGGQAGAGPFPAQRPTVAAPIPPRRPASVGTATVPAWQRGGGGYPSFANFQAAQQRFPAAGTAPGPTTFLQRLFGGGQPSTGMTGMLRGNPSQMYGGQ